MDTFQTDGEFNIGDGKTHEFIQRSLPGLVVLRNLSDSATAVVTISNNSSTNPTSRNIQLVAGTHSIIRLYPHDDVQIKHNSGTGDLKINYTYARRN